jgi:hypothetical protein
MSASPRLWAAVLLLVPFLTGCGSGASDAPQLGTGEIRWASFPVAIQADPALLRSSSSKRDLYAAMDFWEERAGRPLFNLTGAWEGDAPYVGNPANPDQILANVIYFQGPWPFESTIAGKTVVRSNNNVIESAVVLINYEKGLCKGNCYNDPTGISQRKLIAHELGHFLGFGHTNNRSDIMFPEILGGETLEETAVNMNLLEKLTD